MTDEKESLMKTGTTGADANKEMRTGLRRDLGKCSKIECSCRIVECFATTWAGVNRGLK